MTNLKIAGALLSLMAFTLTTQAQVNLYPAMGGSMLPASQDYSVEVRAKAGEEWQQVEVLRCEVDLDKVESASFAQFDMEAPVELRVACHRTQGSSLSLAVVRPLSLHIQAVQPAPDTLLFTLDHPAYLSIEFDGERKHNLHLFANPMEQERYRGNEADCINWGGTKSHDVFMKNARLIYFGPGVHKPKDLPGDEIKIPSNTTVYIAPGAVIKAKLCVDHARNVRIVGRGIIDHPLRGIEITHSRNVTVEGLTILNPQHYTVYGGQSDSITLRDLKSFSCKPWSDGIDLMSCSDVTIDNVFLRTSDDCIALYNHRWWFWGDTRNVTVTRAVLWADVAHPINMGTHGDDKSAEGEKIENVTFRNIDILEEDEDCDPYRGVMAISCGDKNRIEDVLFDSIRVEPIEEGRLFNLQVMFNETYNQQPGGSIRNITFRNITFTTGSGTLYPSWIKGYDATHRVSGIHFENVVIDGRPLKDIKDFETNSFVDDVTVK